MKAKYLILLILIIFHIEYVFSFTTRGGEISYKWLGDKIYEINFNVYRDCRGIDMPNGKLYIFSENDSLEIPYERTSIERVLPMCKENTTACNPNIPNNEKGVEKHTFKAYVDLDNENIKNFIKGCQIFFGFKCGKFLTTTLAKFESEFYMECMLNICATHENSSPVFYENLLFYGYCNNPINSGFAAKDYEDYDSLSYEIYHPRSFYNKIENYSSPFSNLIPMTPFCPPNPGKINCKPLPNANPSQGFYFNKTNGALIFSPANCDEWGYISVISIDTRIINNQVVIIGFSNIVRHIDIRTGSNEKLNQIGGTDKFTIRYDNPNIGYTYKTNYNNIGSQLVEPVDSFLIVDKPDWVICETKHNSNSSELNMIITYPFELIEQHNKNYTFQLKIQAIKKNCPNEHYQNFTEKIITVNIIGAEKHVVFKPIFYNDSNKNFSKDKTERPNSGVIFIKNLATNKTEVKVVEANETLRLPYKKFEVTYKFKPYEIGDFQKDTFNLSYFTQTSIEYPIQHKNGIYGRVFFDENGNSKKDKDEQYLSEILIKTQTKHFGFSDKDGMFYIDAPAGYYELMVENVNGKFIQSNKIELNLNNFECSYNNDIPLKIGPNFKRDLEIKLNGKLQVSRGDNSVIKVTITNNGNYYTKASKLSYNISKNNFIFIDKKDLNINIVEINLPALEPGKTINYNINFTANHLILINNDNLKFDFKIEENDDNNLNNQKNIVIKIIAPHDPNDIQIVGDTFKTALDNKITFQIRCQNTGNDFARNILVTDTIDFKFFDLEKFSSNWSDFPCSVYFFDNVIHFYFEGINLPPLSTHGDKSIHTFQFDLGLKTNFTKEISFKNKASIFFDFEDPIITNWAVGNIVSPVELKTKSPNWCSHQVQKVYVYCKFNPNIKTELSLEIIPENGNFNDPILLKKQNISLFDSLIFNIPKNLSFGNYKLKTRTINPTTFNIESSGIIDVKINKFETDLINTNLLNNEICANIPFILNTENQDYIYKIFRNDELINSQNTATLNLGYLKPNEHFKIENYLKNSHCFHIDSISPNIISLPNLVVNLKNNKLKYCDYDFADFSINSEKAYTIIENNIESNFENTFTSYSTLMNQNKTVFFVTKNEKGCYNYSDTFYLKYNPKPNAEFTYTQEVFNNKTFVINLKSTNPNHINQWQWEHNNVINKSIGENLKIKSDSESPIYIKLKVIDSQDCLDETETEIKVKLYPLVFIPNSVSFTLKDQLNDVFQVLIDENVFNFEMEIYNRWGQKILEKNNEQDAIWTPESEGIYTYKIRFTDKDGARYNYVGTITVL